MSVKQQEVFMKTLRLPKTLFAAGLSLFFASAFGADVWVATDGNDSAAGTSTEPLASIAAAVTALGSEGGTIHLKTGTYTIVNTEFLKVAIVETAITINIKANHGGRLTFNFILYT